MTFKLSAQIDTAKDPKAPFEAYRSYIKENFQRFPQSVLVLLENENWYRGSDSSAPYYSEVFDIQFKSLGSPDALLELTLRKEMYTPSPVEITLKYVGLVDANIPMAGMLNCDSMIWRYDQFLVDIVEEEPKAFKHQIEWVGGLIWSITALEIEVSWKTR